MKPIPAGIMLEIKSWEGDADYNQTISLQGLSLEEAKFYVEFLELFRSCNNRVNRSSFGNKSTLTTLEWSSLEDKVSELLNKYPLYKELNKEYMVYLRNFIHDTISELLGCPENEDLMFRVFDRYKAYNIENDIPEIKL